MRKLIRVLQLTAIVFLIAAPFARRLPADSSYVWFRPMVTETVDTCASGTLTPMAMPPLGTPLDLEVTGSCKVPAGNYYYRNVNIYSTKMSSKANPVPPGGTLTFQDATIDFWANSILVENGGTLRAGAADDGTEPGPLGCNDPVKPFGCGGNTLTIHLYGAEDANKTMGMGIACKEGNHCGIPDGIWTSNPVPNPDVKCDKDNLPGGGTDSGVSDCFYQYKPLNYDGGNANAYFGYKTLGISFGGSLQLFGAKGASYDAATNGDASNSGTSWVRLNADLAGSGTEKTLTLDRPVPTWKMGDQIVLTSTDYMPGHAEVLTLAADATPAGNTIAVTTAVQYAHVGHTYSLSKVPDRLNLDPKFKANGVEIRAGVGLLRRSIRIVSGGDSVAMPFPDAPAPNTVPGYFFGAHTLARQGFKLFHVQGVEFYQLGEGGKIGHYPVHFHLARKTAVTTNPTPSQIAFVKDSSVWDSMTRWYVIHGTQDITLARNVGYESIGHGYYLEDATEIDNKLYSNLGVLARAAVINAQNPRQVPGLLAAAYPSQLTPLRGIVNQGQEFVPFHSDIDHPSVFWMTNGWNDFEYNMAAGATSCGVCYWLVPAFNSGPSGQQYWTSYASEQSNSNRVATTPLEKFLGNSCSSAMNSFQTVGNTEQCSGVTIAPGPVPPGGPDPNSPRMVPVHNDLEGVPGGIPKLPETFKAGGPLLTPEQIAKLATYYPNVDSGGGRFATKCPDGMDCSNGAQVPKCAAGQEQNCTATVLDHYTTSFNWSNFNFAALWLRPQWYLVINSAITDVQGGGITFVTGGGYTDADEIPGHWGLAYKTVFVGQTQPDNPYAFAGGPFNPGTAAKTGMFKLACQLQKNGALASFCLDQDQGVSFPTSNFGGNQRFFNIYDGPSYEDSNAYLDIKKTTGLDCKADAAGCTTSQWFSARQLGTPRDNTIAGIDNCYLPNAAIAWKQPNGFYYPPAFHSNNLFFDNVDIRHYVISPLFLPGTLTTDPNKVKDHYCQQTSNMFVNWTDVDRQTELDDDDGSLTGFADTVSVNLDTFFTAPVEGIECASGPYKDPLTSPLPPGTVKTSPYNYVTTAIFPKCFARDPGDDKCNGDNPPHEPWRVGCSDPSCYGVPIYRQYVTEQEKNGPPMPVAIPTPSIRLMGQDQAQRSGLTVNNAEYYIDTSVGKDTQTSNVFEKGNTYYTYFLFATPDTKQTYQIYVGKSATWDPKKNVHMVRAEFPSFPYVFDQGKWPAQWKRDASDGPGVGYDPSTGIETLTVDMNGYADFKTDYDKSKANECAPAGFCAPNDSNACTCQLDSGDPLFNDCQYVCSNWANKDVKCPNDKCFGFSITMSSKFETIPKGQPRPQATPACFPNDIFNISVTNVGADLAGDCSTAVIPPFQACN
jgi:hypothetical protein